MPIHVVPRGCSAAACWPSGALRAARGCFSRRCHHPVRGLAPCTRRFRRSAAEAGSGCGLCRCREGSR
eukprot:6902747-Pyramimonas_sp.AAC.1